MENRQIEKCDKVRQNRDKHTMKKINGAINVIKKINCLTALLIFGTWRIACKYDVHYILSVRPSL